MMRRFQVFCLVVCLAAATALGQQTGLESSSERPWAKGVAPAKQKEALELFRVGNAALKDSLFPRAAQKYREALALWDHPAIHYNLALALVNLDQPIELHEHLVAALKYGTDPLDADKFAQAQRYKALIEKQLSKLTITCAVEGAVVKLDGRPVFTAPGHYSSLVRAGPHTVAASRDGFLPHEDSPTLAPGVPTTIEVKLITAQDLTEYRRLWSNWVPWSVVAGGALLLGSSVGLHLGAKSAFTDYDRAITACVTPSIGGCRPSTEVAGLRSKGDTLQAAAITGYVVSAAALTTGAVLVYMNRLQPYTGSVDAKPAVTVGPLLGPGVAGAFLLGTF